MTKMHTGMTSADEDAINPYVTIPFAKACPEAPRVPNNDSRTTTGPSDRPARK